MVSAFGSVFDTLPFANFSSATDGEYFAVALDAVLRPKGVAVIVEASHGCMSTRGVNQHGVSMVTKCWLGDFKADPELRRELFESIRGRSALA